MRQTGDLRERVRLYRRVTSTAAGQSVETLEDILPGSVAAEVYSQSDRAFAAGDARYQESVIFCTIRKPVSVTLEPGLRLRYHGQLYEVVEIVPGTMRGTLRLRCVHVGTRGDGVRDD